MAHTIETLTARFQAEHRDAPNETRIARFARAIELGATDAALEALADARRTSTTDTIELPSHRYEGLSRGKGWARLGRGDKVSWGERTGGGYECGPGKWTVGGNDGFSRKGENKWEVKHVKVGSETWTVAS